MCDEILRQARWIVINSSAGKDSQAMLDFMAAEVKRLGLAPERVVVVHADLGRVEWQGTRELAEEQAKHYGFRFEVVKYSRRDLLEQVRLRRRWPSSTARYCTSDHKRGPIRTLFTKLIRESGPGIIVNCLGLRADESPARAKRPAFVFDEQASNGKRKVYNYLPIHSWSKGQVWERIRASGVRHHPAYDLGMPRLSCCFCIFSPRAALLVAGKHNPELLNQYVEVEKEIGHKFRMNLSLVEVQEAVQCGEEVAHVDDWSM